jgi:hypothetical protein
MSLQARYDLGVAETEVGPEIRTLPTRARQHAVKPSKRAGEGTV